MLVLSRKKGERVVIGDIVEMTIISIQGDRVRLGFTAPPAVPINRSEIHERISDEEQAAREIHEPAYK